MADIVKPFQSTLRIDFATEDRADLVKQCMEVDEELTNRVTKVLLVDGSHLIV